MPSRMESPAEPRVRTLPPRSAREENFSIPDADAYLVTIAGNTVFDGTRFGVAFANGAAVVNESTIDKKLGYSVREVAQRMMDLGEQYIVQPVSYATEKR